MSDIVWPNTDNCKKLSASEAKFIFDQAEKQVKETSEVGNLVVSRATTLITLVSGLIIGLMGFVINRWQTLQHFDVLLYTALFGILYLFVILILLTNNIRGKDYYIVGAEPKSLFVDAFFTTPKEQREIRFFVNEIINYQRKIELNKTTNIKRWKWFNRALYAVTFAPIIIFAAYLLISFIIG